MADNKKIYTFAVRLLIKTDKKMYNKYNNNKFHEVYISLGNTKERQAWVLKIAELTNRAPSTIYQWLLGRTQPTPRTAEMVARELGVPAEELFEGVLQNKYTGRSAQSDNHE